MPKQYRFPGVSALCLCVMAVSLCGVPVIAQAPAAAPAPAGPVDEFGVSLSRTPPAIPPGYKTNDELKAAFFSGKIEILDIQGDLPLLPGITEQKDIEYGKVGDRALLLDLYMPEKIDKPAPGLIFIHGGGWKSGNKNDYRYYAMRYAKRGFVVASISYRFSQEALFPGCVQDAKCAVRWMRANAKKYNVDPNRLAAAGGSAGGYLSMMIGYSSDVPEFEGDGGYPGVSSRVQAVVNLYGPCDLFCQEARDVDVVKEFLGKSYDEDPELYKKASPITHITKDDPPTLILQGTIDDIVPAWQSDQLAAKLKETGVIVDYQKFEGWPHTMDVAVPVNQCCQWFMNRFFAEHLAAKK